MGIADESATKRILELDPPEWKDIPAQRKPDDMVQYIVEKGLTEVPAEYIQPLHMRPAQQQRSQLGSDNGSVPVIDMALLKDEEGKTQVQAEIIRACEDWGFFQVINHGVPATLMDAVMDMAKRFFALTSEEKEVFKIREGTLGVGYGRFFDKNAQTREWLDRLILNVPASMAQFRDVVDTVDFVVDNPPGFQDVFNDYGSALYELTKEIMAIISEELGQPPDFLFHKIGSEKSFIKTAMNYYPPCPQPELVLGLPPHGDASALTILQQDGVPGLEVMKDGVWIPVPPATPHSLVVNIGDNLQMISNARFKSSLHRAVVPNTSRFSIGCFVVPYREAVLQPAAELCNHMNPPLYKAVTYQEYLVEFLKQGINTNSRVVETFRLVPEKAAVLNSFLRSFESINRFLELQHHNGVELAWHHPSCLQLKFCTMLK